MPEDVGAWLRGLADREPGPLVDHLLDCKLRELRPSTLVSRWHALHRVRVDVGAELLEVDEATMREWWRRLGSRLAASTRAVQLSHLRSFYRWAQLEELVELDPTRRIIPPRRPRRVPRPADPAELRRLLEHLDGSRDWLPVALAVFCGMRAMEVAAVRPGDLRDVDSGHPGLLVVGKGGHQRVVPVPTVLADRLAQLHPSDEPAVRNRSGRPYSAHEMSYRLGTVLRSHGVQATGHMLRHSYATEAYRTGRDLLATQNALGHRNVASTGIYARADDQAVRAAAAGAWSALGLEPDERRNA